MFELTEADVFRLVEMFAASDATFMQVRVDDVELVLSRNDQDGIPTGSEPRPSSLAAPSPPAPAAVAPPVTAAVEPVPSPTPTTPSGDPGLVTVNAPSIGAFYRAPRPDLPPYVEVGAMVEADATVGLIEAMKVFTGVTAGVRGTVVEVLVEDAQFVEYDQPLFRIRPLQTEDAATS